ncbi:hypothetical protein ACRAWD_25525 [Caulobacter segnis]
MAGKGGRRHRAEHRHGACSARTGMSAYEMMLSESQERMLAVLQARPRAGRPRHLREVGPGRRRHRLHHRHRPPGAASTTARPSATCRWPGRCSTTRRCMTVPGSSPRSTRVWIRARSPARPTGTRRS